MRWSAENKGKQGGVRVIYYNFLENSMIVCFSVYAKSRQENISPNALKEKKQMTLPKFENIDTIVQAIIDDDPDAEVVRESLTRSLQDFNEGRYRINPATIRKQNSLSQSQFARAIGISVNTLKSWEQGQRQPLGSARVLLDLLAKRPELINELAVG